MKKYRVALAGNPNVGKSTIFNILTGLHQHTGNWAGKTRDNALGKYQYENDWYEVYDLPGTYSLRARSLEEEIARDFIVSGQADVTVVVCNAVCLERSLNLVLQILEITSNVIVVVNLLDEAKKKKIEIDLEELSSLLGVPVIGCAASQKKGIKELVLEIKKRIQNPTLKVLIDLEESMSKLEHATNIARRSQQICTRVVQVEEDVYLKRDRKIDWLLTNKVTGIPIMLLMLFGIFWLTIVGSNVPSEMLSNFLFGLEEPLYQVLQFLPTFLNDLLVHGVYKTTAWVVSVMLPPMLIFFHYLLF